MVSSDGTVRSTRQRPPFVYISNGGRVTWGALLVHPKSLLPVYTFLFFCIVHLYHFVIVQIVTIF